MKKITALLILYVILFLTVDLFDKIEHNKVSKKNPLAEISVAPSLLFDSPLALENRLFDLRKVEQDKLIEAKVNAQEQRTEATFSIGDIDYRLYGIFSLENKPFILLKGKDNMLRKFTLGQIVNQYRLSEINNRRIIFNQDDQTIEFNLFEPKNNDNTQ